MIAFKPAFPGSVIVIEMDETMTIMFSALEEAIAMKKRDCDKLTQVATIAYTEFLLTQGLEFRSSEDLNEYDDEFFTELSESFRKMMWN